MRKNSTRKGVVAVRVDVLDFVWTLGLHPADMQARRVERLAWSARLVDERPLRVAANPRWLVDDHHTWVTMSVLGFSLTGPDLDLEHARERPRKENTVRTRRGDRSLQRGSPLPLTGARTKPPTSRLRRWKAPH
jgi:hypothetical protein